MKVKIQCPHEGASPLIAGVASAEVQIIKKIPGSERFNRLLADVRVRGWQSNVSVSPPPLSAKSSNEFDFAVKV